VSYRFLVDTPLGRLARWLRILGFDTEYVKETQKNRIRFFTDSERIAIVRPGKIKNLKNRACYAIKSDRIFDQIAEIREHLGLTLEDTKPFSRCICCNSTIELVSKHDIRGLVPDYVWHRHASFNRCAQCGRIYWRGSHIEKSRSTILKLFH